MFKASVKETDVHGRTRIKVVIAGRTVALCLTVQLANMLAEAINAKPGLAELLVGHEMSLSNSGDPIQLQG